MKVDKFRKDRLKDFSARCGYPGAEVCSMGGCVYIPIHPFADEVELLEKLGVAPEECIKADGYVRAFEDVGFLQVITARVASSLSAGQYVRKDKRPPHLTQMMVVLPETEQFVTRASFEKGASRLGRLFQEETHLELTSNLERLD